jgi:hypothetical protein
MNIALYALRIDLFDLAITHKFLNAYQTQEKNFVLYRKKKPYLKNKASYPTQSESNIA